MNLAHIIDDHAADRVALLDRGRSITYGELRDEIARVRTGLAARGVVAGDRIALVCGNSPSFVATYFAALGLGAVVLPVNPTSPPPELASEIAAVGASVVVVEQVGAASWAGVDTAEVPTVRLVVAANDDVADRVTASGRGTSDGAATRPAPDVVTYGELAGSPDDGGEVAPVVEVDDDTLAVLIFTSGTAGAPRAAMLTHGNLLSNLRQGRGSGEMSPDDLVYGVLPLFHIFGLNIVIGMSFYVGATVMLVQRFDPSTAASSIRERGVTVVPGAPTMWSAFTHFDELAPDTFASVRLAMSGASRLPISVAEAMRDRFGVEIAEGYGLTEASPVVTSSVGLPARFGSVGRALDGVEVRLVNVNGDALVGDVGEIWVRGDNVFAGYLDDPEATAAVLTDDGWLRTGDMAIADDDGWLYLVDRAKDLIIVSGFNVYPAEVEQVLVNHPAVAEAAVVGVPHPHTGEAVKAFVVMAEGADVDEDTLIEHSLDYLARYKCPTKVLFVSELPRNANGKVVRRQLDDALAMS
jgi:long-chain acyl-CoA synthetase